MAKIKSRKGDGGRDDGGSAIIHAIPSVQPAVQMEGVEGAAVVTQFIRECGGLPPSASFRLMSVRGSVCGRNCSRWLSTLREGEEGKAERESRYVAVHRGYQMANHKGNDTGGGSPTVEAYCKCHKICGILIKGAMSHNLLTPLARACAWTEPGFTRIQARYRPPSITNKSISRGSAAKRKVLM